MSGITVIASVSVRQGCPVRIDRHPRIKKGRRWRPPRDKKTSKSTLDVKVHRVTSPIHNPASRVQANIHHQLYNRSALASLVNNSKQARLPGYKRGHDTHRGHTFRSRAVRANRSPIETVGSGGLLLAEKSPLLVASAIHRVSNDGALAQRLRQAGRQRAKNFESGITQEKFRRQISNLILESL